MKVSDTISFPTNAEMRLYTARLLRKSRREEIKILSRQYELIADAIEGYRILFFIWLKRFFAGSLALGGCMILFYQLNNSIPLETATQALNQERRFSYVPSISVGNSDDDYSKMISINTSKYARVALAKSSDRAESEMSFQYEPDTFKTLHVEPKRTEFFRMKYYMDLGFKIRFVEGYMLSDHAYDFPRNMDVPILGGLPAEYENKKSKEIDREDLSHVFSYQRNVDQAIRGYAAGDWIGAVTKLQGLLEKFPNDVNLNFYLGMSYYHLGEYQKALSYLGSAVSLENSLFDQEQDFYIAMSYLKNGQEGLAVEYLDVIAHSNSFYSKRAKELMK